MKTHEFSTPEYGKGEASGPTGYTTTVVYRLPAGTRASSVRRFYGATLGRRGWRSSATGTQAIVDFERGRMLTVVNTITLLRSSTYLVAVDSGR